MSMFIKSALAMLLTVGFAGGAVYYGTGGRLDGQKLGQNEVNLPPSTKASQEGGAQTLGAGKSDRAQNSQKQNLAPSQSKAQDAVQGAQRDLPPSHTAPKTSSATSPENITPPAPSHDAANLMPVIMQQIDKMKDAGTKDQAYFDVVAFAVSQRQYKYADAAMREIKQMELRETARSKIAVALALDGRADDAFEVIDAVSDESLRDFMRLQVIEALIVPQNLPPVMVPQ